MPDLLAKINAQDVDGVATCLDDGAKVNTLQGGVTPLSAAVARGSSDALLRLLLNHGADVNLGSRSGETPLMVAANQGHPGITRFLLQNGANVNAEDKHGATALMIATMRDPYSLRELIQAGADINHTDCGGFSALDYAYNAKQHQSAVLLLEAGADVQKTRLVKNRRAATAVNWLTQTAPIIYAVERKDVTAARMLLTQGVSPNARIGDDSKKPVLVVAARGGSVNMVRLLLEQGADVNIVSAGGWSALMEAAAAGQEAVVSLLLEHGADVSAALVTTKRTCLSLAATAGHKKVVVRLLDHAKACHAALDVAAALDLATQNEHWAVVEVLAT